jgi:hypothetical protein
MSLVNKDSFSNNGLLYLHGAIFFNVKNINPKSYGLLKLKNWGVMPTAICFNDGSKTCLKNWFQSGNVLLKSMQKSFASYELEVLHYGLLIVEKTHLFLKVHHI